MKGHKAQHRRSTIDTVVEDGKTEIEAMRDEMEEWQSNLSDCGLDGTGKYDEVTEAYDCLDEAYNELDNLMLDELPQSIREYEVEYVEWNAYGIKSNSRAVRSMNVSSGLEAAHNHIGGLLEDDEDGTIASTVESLQGTIDALCNATFPGMFG